MISLGNTYTEVLRALYALEARRGMDLTLGRTRTVLEALGNPQNRFASIHIAGTNGKGSVAAMLHAMALAAGFKTALYTSPHLVNFTERIRVGWSEVDEASIVMLANEVVAAASDINVDLTFFEVTTIMAFLQFARSGVELAVVETGLGGRFDATNVIDPVVSIITSIGFDHEEFLGTDLASIAFEKSGIIKTRRPVVTGVLPEAARMVVEDIAIQHQAPLVVAKDLGDHDVPVALRGLYQRSNAAIATVAAGLLPSPWQLAVSDIRAGLASAVWPGRLAIIEREPLLILDGAHNPDGVAQLCAEVPRLAGQRRLHLLFSVMRDKRWREMVAALAGVVSSVTVTSASPNRAADVDEVARAFASKGIAAATERDPAVAFRHLSASVDRHDGILVAGSLFLVGAIYRLLLKDIGRERLFDAAHGLHPLVC